MCYCCTLCNECGRADEMNGQLGRRKCPGCGVLVLDEDVRACPECGATLPPPFPPLPGSPQG
ncbi:hypothetical protein [Adlercreutzia faecimuris]|uniref:Zinc-ribbon domain-containing protein n=1 Tax=Adlercreutzia faecimuris TaxID=2897341 RepID=A0ABS9WHY4_9ACTN|nr:hypothetical protein [Adlercreutzia sp. JBNU-10]MCI2242488.1 hypothetical protein [Adlercreutzia sp. JBNU-10]